jgi:methanethiol S-methyltransferase
MSVRPASGGTIRHTRRPWPAAGLGYAVLSYAASLVVLGWSFAFIGGLWLPATIDRGPHLAWPLAAGLDLLLLAVFAVQHSVMARPWFKRRWTRLVPGPAERASYVLASSLALGLLLWLWRPIPQPVWQAGGTAAVALRTGYCAGWLLAFSSTFMISHFDLFGVRQAWLRLRGTSYRPPQFTRRGLYALVRHPLMTGFLIVFWVTPVMTAGHLLLAVAATGYILAGIRLEERDLGRELGASYRTYQREVRALVPVPRRRPVPGSSRR